MCNAEWIKYRGSNVICKRASRSEKIRKRDKGIIYITRTREHPYNIQIYLYVFNPLTSQWIRIDFRRLFIP